MFLVMGGLTFVWILCEVHLWSEHLAVMAGQPFCGSDNFCIMDLMSQGPPPPAEGLQRPYGQYTIYTYGRLARYDTWY